MRRFLSLPDAFSDVSAESLVEGKWIQASPFAEFEHPIYGDVKVTPELVSQMKANFDANVYGQDVPLTYEHFGMDSAKGFKAAGWLKDIEVRDDGMYWFVAFTQEAAEEIAQGAWRYFSPEWYDVWRDPESGMAYTYVVAGGALTNQPFFKGMQPLNFSTLVAAGLADSVPTDSTADWEHSEPGSETPREDEEEAIDGQGTRGPSPDVEPEAEEYAMKDFLTKLRSALELAEDADESTVLTALSDMVALAKPLKDAEAEADKHLAFSQAYPAEFERLKALENTERENKARAFSDRYATLRLVKGEGETAEATTYGFSARTVDDIKNLHLAFSIGQMTEEHIEKVLDSLLNTGLVDYSEHGTSVVHETPENAPQAFADTVAKIRKEEEVDYNTAVALASSRNPELFQAYREAVKTKRS